MLEYILFMLRIMLLRLKTFKICTFEVEICLQSGTYYVEFATQMRKSRLSFLVTEKGSRTRRRVDAAGGVGDTPATSKSRGWTQ